MATQPSQEIDKTQVPDYPDDVAVQDPAAIKHNNGLRAELGVHHQNPGWVQHDISGTVNVVQGSWEWDREVGKGDTLKIHLRTIYSAYRKSKSDNTSFNLWNRHGEIAFHVSFRRHDQEIVFNAWSGGRWGTECRIDFPQKLKDEVPLDLDIVYHGEGIYNVTLDRAVSINVDPCDPPNSLTYRASDGAMFGQNVDGDLSWYELE